MEAGYTRFYWWRFDHMASITMHVLKMKLFFEIFYLRICQKSWENISDIDKHAPACGVFESFDAVECMLNECILNAYWINVYWMFMYFLCNCSIGSTGTFICVESYNNTTIEYYIHYVDNYKNDRILVELTNWRTCEIIKDSHSPLTVN